MSEGPQPFDPLRLLANHEITAKPAEKDDERRARLARESAAFYLCLMLLAATFIVSLWLLVRSGDPDTRGFARSALLLIIGGIAGYALKR